MVSSLRSAHFLFHYQSLLARRKAAAERHIALFYSVRDPSRHIWQQFHAAE